MAAVVSLPEQRMVLESISWDTYERLLIDSENYPATRFTYDKGRLEIMVVSSEHEAIKDRIFLLVNIVAEVLEIDMESFGSTTFKRQASERGFEPDACFYIQHEAQVTAQRQLNLSVDPPPDLIIEIDFTSPSLGRFPIFASFGIGEIWRYNDSCWTFFRLEAGEYVEIEESSALPKVTSAALTELIEASITMKRTAWLKQVRDYAQTLKTE